MLQGEQLLQVGQRVGVAARLVVRSVGVLRCSTGKQWLEYSILLGRRRSPDEAERKQTHAEEEQAEENPRRIRSTGQQQSLHQTVSCETVASGPVAFIKTQSSHLIGPFAHEAWEANRDAGCGEAPLAALCQLSPDDLMVAVW